MSIHCDHKHEILPHEPIQAEIIADGKDAGSGQVRYHVKLSNGTIEIQTHDLHDEEISYLDTLPPISASNKAAGGKFFGMNNAVYDVDQMEALVTDREPDINIDPKMFSSAIDIRFTVSNQCFHLINIIYSIIHSEELTTSCFI